MKDLFENNGAEFSVCRKYRYCLWRIWDESLPKIMIIGLNPSKANEVTNDATIRRMIAFAKLWGYGGIYMLNCFPYIATDPSDLKDFGNTDENDQWIHTVSNKVQEIIFAWGGKKEAMERGKKLEKLYPMANCLGKNKNGSPKHPLYLPYKLTRIKY